jgi:phosphopantothenoylcysteine decarboxylase/phosphopantothenate--cysteine ligase
MVITAGPTHEPIDAVRYVGNRSSGRVGVALADAAARAGWTVRLMLGPVAVSPSDSRVTVRRFRTCEDLRGLLKQESGRCDVLVMAAAVADYRPRPDPAFTGGKFRRQDQKLVLELEATPDLLAEVSASKRPDQLFVGFALEPRHELEASAKAKLTRKRVDLVVGNPLETMDSPTIEAMVLGADGSRTTTDGVIPKDEFAGWLVRLIGERFAAMPRTRGDA